MTEMTTQSKSFFWGHRPFKGGTIADERRNPATLAKLLRKLRRKAR